MCAGYLQSAHTCCRRSSRSFFSCAASFLLLSRLFAAASSSAPSFCLPHIYRWFCIMFMIVRLDEQTRQNKSMIRTALTPISAAACCLSAFYAYLHSECQKQKKD